MKPGKKGISLNLEQWQRLIDVLPAIQDEIDATTRKSQTDVRDTGRKGREEKKGEEDEEGEE